MKNENGVVLRATVLDEKREPIADGTIVLGRVNSPIEFYPNEHPDQVLLTKKAKRVVVDPGVEFAIASIVPLGQESPVPCFHLDIEV